MDPKTGEVSGPAADLTRELGRQLGVPVSIMGVAGVRAVTDAVKDPHGGISQVSRLQTRRAVSTVSSSHVSRRFRGAAISCRSSLLCTR